MQKKGDFNLSFGMIFSIIIIIAIIGIAFYVIMHFLALNKCSQVGLFYDNLKGYTNDAWQSTIHRDRFPNGKYSGNLPSDIELVCFGLLTQNPERQYRDVFDLILKYSINKESHNVFLYPPDKACDGSLSSIKLEHAEISGFFCLPANNGNIGLLTEKTEFDSLVKIKPST